MSSEAKKVVIDEEGVLRIKGRVYVPRMDNLIQTILEEAYSSRYSIHPGATKMYRDLRQRLLDQFLPLVEFTYNNSYHSSIDMAPFEALYGRKCRPPIGWFDTFKVRPWGTDMLRESPDKVKLIQENLLAAQRRQKEYADRKVRDLEFMVGEQVLLKAAYELALPPGLFGVHLVFHVSMLKRYHGDGPYVIRWDSVLLDENFSYEEEPVAKLDREVRKLRSKEITTVKDQWKNHHVEESTWETKSDMRNKYPHLFAESSTFFRCSFPLVCSGTNGYSIGI
ncbi:uncharacterized protein LOC132040909 [Lycium ferocissimum]|uniref:uncharacterized protein LOC132040909 n=1 Tax=Lycium ferocissimum TaxID=112874 RepID=UPI0028168597|nr:uncharacterized protein LOC132040909 [Lycium ferocissimum]